MLKCPDCSSAMKIRNRELVGKTIKCPKCSGRITIAETKSISDASPQSQSPRPNSKVVRKKQAETDDSWNSNDYESDAADDPGSVFHDPYSNKLPPRSGAKSAKKTTATEVKKDSGGPPRWLIPAVIGGALLLVVAIVSVIVKLASSGDGEAPIAKDSPASAENSDSGKTPAEEVQFAVSKMVSQLQRGAYEDFVLEHAPLPILNECLKDGDFDRFKLSAASFQELRRELIKELETLKDLDVTLDSTGRVASFVPRRDENIRDLPEMKNPYTVLQGRHGVTAGYGSDLKVAIELAIDDLLNDNRKKFIDNMFPPSLLLLLDDENRRQELATDPAFGNMLSMMRDDFMAMSKKDAKIDGNTATFVLPRRVTIGNQTVIDGEREIRFVLMDQHWKLHDGSAGLAKRIGETLTRPMATVKDSTLIHSVRLIKVGRDWRLLQLPSSPKKNPGR